MNEITQARKSIGISRMQMCRDLKIPLRTAEDWEYERNIPAPYVKNFLLYVLDHYEAYIKWEND